MMDTGNPNGNKGTAGLLEPTEQAVPTSTEAGVPSVEAIGTPASKVPAGNGYTYIPPVPPPAEVRASERQPGNPALALVVAIIGLVVLLAIAMWIVTLATAGRIVGEIAVGPGELTTETSAVMLGDAKSGDIVLDMNVGNISVSGGADAASLASATFTYNVPQWKPEVQHSASAGTLTIKQPDEDNNVVGNTRYEWKVLVNNNVPSTLNINLGVGNVELDLGGTGVTDLVVDNHTGNTTVNLAGAWKNSLDATVTGGVGRTELKVPADTGVKVTVQRGLGNVIVNGLTANGDVYTNDAYGKTPTTLTIDAKVGVGELTIEAVK